MKEVTCNVYDFNELPQISQQRIKNRIIAQKWFDESIKKAIEDMAMELLRVNGLDTLTEIQGSLNCSEGDGIAFYGPVNLFRFMEFHNLDNIEGLGEYESFILELDVYVLHKKMYNHNSNSMIVKHYFDYHKDEFSGKRFPWEQPDNEPPLTDKIRVDIYQDMLNVIKKLEEKLVSLSKEITTRGYQVMDQFYSEENITEYCRENDIYFFENSLEYRP
jgi:hypothetical protein